MTQPRKTSWFAAIAPGILVAATGVGAGDLLTASLAGSRVGVALIWAALLGAALKWTLNEGLARWQMATGATLLEGWFDRLGAWIQWLFLGYLLIWSFAVGGALVNACGVAGAGLFPFGDAQDAKIVWGIVHSLAGMALVLIGGFRLFEVLMAVCIGVMFVAVTASAVLVPGTDWAEVAAGLVPRQLPSADEMPWVIGVLGGVGGTVTLLSYGYWIRERQRTGEAGVRACRIDLTIGYAMTAMFGAAMIIIGSHAQLKKGPTMALELAGVLEHALGPGGRWIFLAGFWGAVFSSLLGVWQSVPYLFADFLSLRKATSPPRRDVDFARTPAYRAALVAIAVIPLPLLWRNVQQVQVAYAVLGAMFMPLLAATLLYMNNRTAWVGARFRSGWLINAVLVITLAYFTFEGGRKIYQEIGAKPAPALKTAPKR